VRGALLRRLARDVDAVWAEAASVRRHSNTLPGLARRQSGVTEGQSDGDRAGGGSAANFMLLSSPSDLGGCGQEPASIASSASSGGPLSGSNLIACHPKRVCTHSMLKVRPRAAAAPALRRGRPAAPPPQPRQYTA
jgi:hypothetical protein